MHNHYIINEAVEFHPATSTLRDIHTPDNIVTINSPAGRCLLLLINRFGEIVTQSEFMDFAWRQRGLMVTPNTYYQSISVLRKSLKRIGLGDDLIVTLPRIGLTLASETRIRKEPKNKDNETNYKLDDLPKTLLTNASEKKHIRKSHFSYVFRNWNIKTQRAILYIMMILVIFSCVFFLFQRFFYSKNDFFSDYTTFTTLKKCQVLLPLKNHSVYEKKNAIRFAEQYTQNCETNFAWIYITTAPTNPRTSVIRCNKPFNESTICTSVYFIE